MLPVNEKMSFIHLHLHSNYSLCYGANSIEDICTAVKQMNMSALAITDINGIYGLIWYIQVAKEYGLDPIIGSEIRTEGERCVVLAKNLTGYATLCRIITARQCQDNFNLANYLKSDHRDVIVFSDSVPLLQQLKGVIPANSLFAELVPSGNREQVKNFARSNQIALVAGGDVFFIHPGDWQVHRLLRAIALNTTLDRVPESELESPEKFLRSAQQMTQLFPDCPEALENTVKLAKQCLFDLDFRGFIFPSYKGPNGEDAFTYLRDLVMRGAIWRYGKITMEVKGRLDYELTIILDKGFAPYFLVVADVVRQAPRTCGRGSAAASLVSYCLGITHVDPIRYNLYFERFLHADRSDPPDIDVDFPWDERDQILDYIFKKYGRQCTAMIANHNGFRARAAIREVAKVFGIPDADIKKITDKMSGFWQPVEIQTMITEHPVYRHTDFEEPWPEIIVMAEKLEGFPRHLSVHCGGVIIATDGLTRYVPYQPAKKQLAITSDNQDGSTGLPGKDIASIQVVQWEKDQSEAMGLVKMDILGNRSLAVIRDALAAIKQNYGVDINYPQWNPLNDTRTIELLARGDTIGVFYVESPAMRLLQKKTGFGDFEHLVIHSSIIRPAANTYINEYIRRVKGGKYQPLHPVLATVLNETFGIMVYQEDISRVAMALAGFSAADADKLRKVIPNKRKVKILNQLQQKFIEGAQSRGVKQEIIDQIWHMFMSFSGYSFCKPHSASYALVSFKSAYLRAHYPGEFMAAVISNQGGYYSTFAYISEARRMGLTILPLDINASELHYTGTKNSIRVGFMQLKGISHKTIVQILDERKKNGPFRSFDEFLRRLKIEPSDCKILIKAGVFDAIESNKTRPQLIWLLYHRTTENRQIRQQLSLAFFDEQQDIATPIPQIEEYDRKTRLQHEKEAFGLLISCHPLELYHDRLQSIRYVSAQYLDRYVGKEVNTVGWLITRKLARTKSDEMMEFMSFEDTTAIYETTFFPAIYNKFIYMMSQDRPLILTGRVESQFGAITLTVASVRML